MVKYIKMKFITAKETGMGLFKSYSEKQIKKLTSTVDKIESLSDKFAALTNEEMRAYTDKL